MPDLFLRTDPPCAPPSHHVSTAWKLDLCSQSYISGRLQYRQQAGLTSSLGHQHLFDLHSSIIQLLKADSQLANSEGS